MSKEVDLSKNKFIMFGVGLGYHIEYLLNEIEQVEIQYILIDEQELNDVVNQEIVHRDNVKLFHNDNYFSKDAQFIIPQPFISAIEHTHPLYEFIEDIKIRQVSYERFKGQMVANFNENIKLYKPLVNEHREHKKAALISSGPSATDTVKWLKKHEDEFDIYCVGSALPIALANQINVKAVFISDAQAEIQRQITYDYTGLLIFLSTANYGAVLKHQGDKQIIFQRGFDLAENFAEKNGAYLYETGGSVATTAFSYIEKLQYAELYLFGQDLSFSMDETHAKTSTSGKSVQDIRNLVEVVANDGSIVKSTPNLVAYKRWFDVACENTTMTVFNTAYKGAQINHVIFLDVLMEAN